MSHFSPTCDYSICIFLISIRLLPPDQPSCSTPTYYAAVNTFTAESRTADYFVLRRPSSKAPAPADDAICRPTTDMRKDSYRPPEFRKATVIIIAPAKMFAKTLQISDNSAKKVYDQTAAQRFVSRKSAPSPS